MCKELDKSSGNVLVYQGDIYYSPNSSRLVTLPSRDSGIGTENTIFQPQTSTADDFTKPYWWTEAFGWLAFVPCYPLYSGSLLERLAKVPKHLDYCVENGRDKYSLPPEMKDSWVKLDWWFLCAAAILAKEFNASVARPFSPWALGYNQGNSSHRRALFQIFRSRDWFNVWMGLVSYLIAKAKSDDQYGMDTYWQRVLCQNHFPFDTIDALYASSVCDFSPNTERAGVFLDLTSNNTNQPSIGWFSKYNIPVWYRWSNKEMSIPSLAYLAPLSSQMQRALLELSNPVQQVRTLAKQPESGKEAPASAKRPEDEVFFAGREEHNARRLLHKSAADRQTRLNRERCPPTVSTQVFEWVRSEDDDNIWCHVPVRKVDREETLEQYSEAQRRYDSFLNEWDCCEEFGPGDEESDEEFYETNDYSTFDAPYDSIARPPTVLTPLQSMQVSDPVRLKVPRVHLIQCASFSSAEPTSEHSKIGALQQKILEILALYFGLIPPHPHPHSPPLLKSEAECKKVVRLLGLSWTQCQPYIGAVPCASLAKSYLENIIAGQRPKNDECDFNIKSHFSLSMSERCQYLRIVQSVGGEARTFYMFDFGNKSEMPWKLSLTTAVNALLVCRLDSRFRESDITEYLLQHGIPFQTFLPLKLAPRAPRQHLPPCVLPMRLSNWEFGIEDYHSYLRQRDILLTQPRARAALMRGGIIWRLGVSSVSFSSVLQGPTGLSSNPNTMITVCDPKTNELFIDDDLTEIEFNLISGTYICETGVIGQTAVCSWFPSATTYMAAGGDYGHWNEACEDKFLWRLEQINGAGHAGSRGPRSASKWRNASRGSRDCRQLFDAMESWSQAFILRMIENNHST